MPRVRRSSEWWPIRSRRNSSYRSRPASVGRRPGSSRRDCSMPPRASWARIRGPPSPRGSSASSIRCRCCSSMAGPTRPCRSRTVVASLPLPDHRWSTGSWTARSTAGHIVQSPGSTSRGWTDSCGPRSVMPGGGPYNRDAGAQQAGDPPLRSSAGGLMAAKILVVDDDPNVQRLLQYTLKQEGYEVVISADGADGFRLWGAESPDLILLDVMLPKLDGYQVATKIRTEEGTTGHVPIIMLTAEREVEQKVRGLRAGADDYLIKPFHPAELMGRIKSLLARFAPHETLVGRPPLGRVLALYGAKGGVGTTTIAINAAIALHRELGRKVALVDGNLQFGDHRVFLDLGLDKKSIVDIVTAPTIDQDLVRQVMVQHDSGVDLLLAPPSPETAELVTQDHMPIIIDQLRGLYDYVLVDIDKRLDDINLGILEAADTMFVVMTADLSCLKNVRLVLETIGHLGYESSKVQLVLNRSNAFTGINVKNAEGALKRNIDFQIVNEYRGAISALNSGAPFMFTKADSLLGRSLLDFARTVDKAPAAAAATQGATLARLPAPSR